MWLKRLLWQTCLIAWLASYLIFVSCGWRHFSGRHILLVKRVISHRHVLRQFLNIKRQLLIVVSCQVTSGVIFPLWYHMILSCPFTWDQIILVPILFPVLRLLPVLSVPLCPCSCPFPCPCLYPFLFPCPCPFPYPCPCPSHKKITSITTFIRRRVKNWFPYSVSA